MNRIIKNTNEITNEVTYTLVVEDGRTFPCRRWFEEKTDKWYVEILKEGREVCGRRYITERFLDGKDEYEFETKTEHREGLSSGNWRSRLTQDELKRLEEAEKTVEELKKIGMERRPVKNDINTKEGLEAEIQRLLEKQRQMRQRQN